MTKAEDACRYFSGSFNCSQSVFTPFGKEKGMSENDCLRISTAFGGGMGRQQFTCGAVCGGAMALGLKFGKGKNDGDEKKQATYDKTVELFEAFSKLNGSSNCRKLLNNLDMRNEKDLALIIEKNLFHTNCRKYVVDAVKLTEQIIDNSK